MKAYLTRSDQIESWFFSLAEKQSFLLPKKTPTGHFRFEPLSLKDNHKNNHRKTPLELFNYKPTILPPGKHIFPDGEILFSYHKDEQGHYHFSQQLDIDEQIIAGVRPCDLKAIHLMDTVFSEGIKDTHYLQRRKKTTIIGFNCISPCDKHCFCGATQSLDFQEGADIFITPLAHNNQALLEVQTPRGKELIKKLHCHPFVNYKELKAQALAQRPSPFGRQFIKPIEQLSQIIHSQEAEVVYQKYAERCFSCGTCNLVCPSCYCFEIKDEFELGLKLNEGQGKKTRHWDACLNPEFAKVAGGHNFRETAAARQRHRVRRKFAYLPEQFGSLFCTGCGRCGRQCTTSIDIFDIVNDVCSFADSLSTDKAQEQELK